MALSLLCPLLRLLVLGLGLPLLCAAAGEPVSGTPGGAEVGGRAGDPRSGASFGDLEEGAELGLHGIGRQVVSRHRAPWPGEVPSRSELHPQPRPQFPACPTWTRKWRKFEGRMSGPVTGHAPSLVYTGSAQTQ